MLLITLGVDPIISAGIGLVGCLSVSVGQSGLEFSPDYLAYRQYHAFLGRRFGRWQALPTVTGVTVKYFSTKSKSSSKYSWSGAPDQHEILIVMLSIPNKSNGIIIAYFPLDDVNQASDFAHKIAEGLQVPVNVYLPSNQFREL